MESIMGEMNKGEHHPLVSVIIATYRREESFRKALISVLRQTYQNIEIIIVDDNADKEWNQKVNNIIENLKHNERNKIFYLKNDENKGSAETRNIGIKSSSGDYITFLDDDDIYLPNKVENQLLHMLEEKSDYSITDLELYNEKNILIEKRRRVYIHKISTEQLLKYHLMYHMTGTDTLMFKKCYLEKIGYFPKINLGDEFYLMEKAIKNEGKFSYLPICNVKAYVHTETDGLSSGESKINGENRLYEYKKKYFNEIDNHERRYINMRHYAVLAFAEKRRKNNLYFIKYAMKSFFSSPAQCIKEIIRIISK